MLAALFTSLFVQGLLLGLAALALLAAAPGLQKRYGPQWLCRLWVVLAVLLLVPVHFLLPKAPALVSVRTEPLYSVNAAPAQGTTEEPPAGTTYAVTNEASGVTRHYIASYQTEQAALPVYSGPPALMYCLPCGHLGCWRRQSGSLAGMQCGGCACAARHSSPPKAGVTLCRRGKARVCLPRRWCTARWWQASCARCCWFRPGRLRTAPRICWRMS